MTARIITVFNQKGGVGKSSIAMQVAGALGLRGNTVKVIDMDRQATATTWAAAAAEAGRPFPAEVSSKHQFGAHIAKEIERMAADADYIIIDCPPAIDSPVAASALIMADVALIPIPPRPADYQSSQAAKQLAIQTKTLNPDLKILVVANMVDTSSSSAKEILAAMEKDKETPLAKSRLGRRVAYSDSPGFGVTVHALEGAKKPVAEVEALVDEVIALAKGINRHG